MPFTPAHAVVALPFLRTPLVPAAIAVGAMTPDLPLFVRGTFIRYEGTHDLVALPFTMILALALLLVWRCVLRPAARELVPSPLARRLPEGWDAGARRALRETFPSTLGTLLLAVSLAIGVASHIVWDLFTHEDRWGLEALPVLTQTWGPLAGYKWIQHGSSALGLAILGVWAIVWLRGRPTASVDRVLPRWVPWAWWLSLPVVLLVAWCGGLVAFGPFHAGWVPEQLAYLVLPPACAVWGMLTLALAVTVQAIRARR